MIGESWENWSHYVRDRRADAYTALVAALKEAEQAVHVALGMVEGNGMPPNWDWLREVRKQARAALKEAGEIE